MSTQPPRRTGAKTLAARERQKRALELRAEGRTLDQVADALGYADKASAHNAIKAALDRQEAAAVDDLRALEGERLDLLQQAVWPLAVAGDLAAVTTCLRIIDRRSRLFGLDLAGHLGIVTATEVDLDGAVARILEVARYTSGIPTELGA